MAKHGIKLSVLFNMIQILNFNWRNGVYAIILICGLCIFGMAFTVYRDVTKENRSVVWCSLVLFNIIFFLSLSILDKTHKIQDTTEYKTILNDRYVICLNPTEIKVNNETFTYCKGKERD